jgi:hypothetical protein
MLIEIGYDRQKAVEYAKRWALDRNPAYYDFSDLGGDCTNFISQCVYAGSGVMNFTPTFGWYYNSLNDRSPSWTGVQFFYNFMMSNDGVGPYGVSTDSYNLDYGDIIQLGNSNGTYYHTLLVCGYTPQQGILICAHTNDSYMRPLNTYYYATARYIHIAGVRKWQG